MESPKIGADNHLDLILMYKSLQQGWQPPDFISEEDYNKLKTDKPSALRGFVGFASSFGGKWFGGYARGKNNNKIRNYLLESKNTLLKRILNLSSDDKFICIDYKKWIHKEGYLFYLDPPYELGINHFGNTRNFNFKEFWEFARQLSINNTVITSTTSWPKDFELIKVLRKRKDMSSTVIYNEVLIKYKG